MTENFEHLTRLILNNWQGQSTESEKSELQDWLNASERNKEWLSKFEDIEWVKAELEEYSSVNLEECRQKLWSRINANEVEESEKEIEVEPEIQPRRININAAMWLAASVIILIVGAIFILPHSAKQPLTAFINESDSPKEITSDTGKIVLTLADGVKHIVDRAQKNETISKDYGVYIEDHKLVFKKVAHFSSGEKSLYNKLIIPKGGFYQLELADGSNVWLNSASTISFPAMDTDKTRNVTITGEAYFEVKKDDRPFIVKLPSGISMEVLGTTFNINTYPDEPYIGVTLIEGHVIVKKADQSTIIKPGQQCRIDGMNTQVIDYADVNAIVAWKNGKFTYVDDSLTTVVRQLSRWYDIPVRYIDTPRVRVSYIGNRSDLADSTVHCLQEGNSRINISIMNDTLVIKK